ncbi:MAG: hypothetical protein FJ091_06890 [Deltaproteobacteria bacterium]|nr:hypothetical protein [Deltaproteobacteria bacterium]
MTRLVVALGLALLLGTPLCAEEERILYAWTSDDGSVHYTDQLARVPEKSRSSAKTFLAKELGAVTRVPAAPARDKAAPPQLELYDGWGEGEWRGETSRLDALVASLSPIVAACATDHVNLSPGDGSRKRREEREEAQKCAEARTALASAQAEREALSERAHRAGAPPGWLRGE